MVRDKEFADPLVLNAGALPGVGDRGRVVRVPQRIDGGATQKELAPWPTISRVLAAA